VNLWLLLKRIKQGNEYARIAKIISASAGFATSKVNVVELEVLPPTLSTHRFSTIPRAILLEKPSFVPNFFIANYARLRFECGALGAFHFRKCNVSIYQIHPYTLLPIFIYLNLKILLAAMGEVIFEIWKTFVLAGFAYSLPQRAH
jgi:hypothetical protein